MCNPPVICLADWLHSVCYGLLALSAESSCCQVNDGNHFHQRRIRPNIAPRVFLLFSFLLCFYGEARLLRSLAGFFWSASSHSLPRKPLQILSGITQPDLHPRLAVVSCASLADDSFASFAKQRWEAPLSPRSPCRLTADG